MALAIEQPLTDLLNSTSKKRLKASLHEVFGIDSLRPGQEAVIRNVLRRADTLAIMPTGAGKSLCYQLPALYLGGLTLVVSPLISLMKDQLEKLIETGIPATLLNSSLSASEEKQALNAVSEGECRILFVTPERLIKEHFVAVLGAGEKAKVALVVVDEAHCISQWGHDFRPAFIEMLHSIKALGRPPILALTATATPAVITDILHQLGMDNASVVNTGVYRANLHFAVEQFTNPHEKCTRLVDKVKELEGAGIVYCSTVAQCNAIHAALLNASVDAQRYNGKMSASDRAKAQDLFMENRSRVMVATNAFGMGIDKPDIRFVIHAQMPGSLEAYYQEAGRAGRDGEPANCILLFELKDKQVQQFFLGGRYPGVDEVLRIAAAVRRLAAENDGQAIEQPVEALHEALPDIGTNKLRTALSLMREIAMVRRTRRGAVKLQPCNADQHADERLREAAQRYTAMAENDRDVLERMIGYAQSAQCRWRIVLDYFATQMVSIGTSRAAARSEFGHGDAGPNIADDLDGGVCGNCDNCLDPPTITPGPREMHEAQYDTQNAQSAARQARTWQVGDEVRVRRYGAGVVTLASGERVAVTFPDGQTRTFISRYLRPKMSRKE
jgi:ATP-dependent DNA helicase RecQ